MIGIAVGVAIVIAVIAIAVLIAVTRTPRHETGMTSFRRHIDALSPEARREVFDRVRKSDTNRDAADDDTTDDDTTDDDPADDSQQER